MTVPSKGTKIQVEISSVYTDVACIEVSGPEAEVQTYDATDLLSGVGMNKKPTGRVDNGSVSFSGFYDPAASNQTYFNTLTTAPALNNWKIIWPTSPAKSVAFAGTLTKRTPKASMGDGLKYDAEIVVDGDLTYA